MIKATTLEELEKKLEKANKLAEKRKPECVIVEFGLYKVPGSTGNVYEVRAGRTAEGEFFIACTCRGALQEHGCYHAAKVFAVHKAEAMSRVEARRKEEEAKFVEQQHNATKGGGNALEDAPYLKQETGKRPEKVGNIRI